MSVIFDKLAYTKRLEEGGLSRNQAEAMGEALHGALTESVATRQDVADTRSDLRHEIHDGVAQLRQEIRDSVTQLRQEVRDNVAQLRQEIRDSNATTGERLAATNANVAAIGGRFDELRFWVFTTGGAIVGLVVLALKVL